MENQVVKLTQEEMERIAALQNNVANNLSTIGRLYLRERQLLSEIDAVKADIEIHLQNNISLGNEEESIISDISSKYGEGRLNLESGEYFPATVNTTEA
jgi:hypothetical protein